MSSTPTEIYWVTIFSLSGAVVNGKKLWCQHWYFEIIWMLTNYLVVVNFMGFESHFLSNVWQGAFGVLWFLKLSASSLVGFINKRHWEQTDKYAFCNSVSMLFGWLISRHGIQKVIIVSNTASCPGDALK